jgi:hypothetical protein
MARPSSRLLVAAALSSVALAAPARAQYQLPEESGFHNATYVGDEPETARLAFYRAEEHKRDGRAKEAGREILKLLRGPTRGLVRQGERLVTTVELASAAFLLGLPSDVREQLWSEESAVEPPPPDELDAASLRAFAARHPLSPRSPPAWLRAGTLELLDGDAAAAAADLERVVHWPLAAATPESELAPLRALAAARLVDAQRRLGEPPIEGPLARWPADSTLLVAGAPRRLGDLLGEARAAPRPAAPGSTLLGDDARASRPAFPSGRPRLAFLQKGSADAMSARDALHRQRFVLPFMLHGAAEEAELRDLPTLAPVVAGDRLVALEREGDGGPGPVALHVRRLADGADCFEPIRSDFDLHVDPREVAVALDRCGLAAHSSKLALTLETRPAASAFGDEGEASTALFGLDLAREGFVEFGITSADLSRDPDLAGFVFAGPPVRVPGRLLVAASRLVGKETECALLAFDDATGRPIGRCLLASASAIPRVADRFLDEEPRRVSPSPVALRDGTAYVCTNLGVIAAVRACDLEVEWLFRYHRIDPPEVGRYDRATRHEGSWIGRAPVALPDRVLATPSDSFYLYSLSRWPSPAGELLLNDPIEKQQYVCWLGADEKECWFLAFEGALSRSYEVVATDHDGARHWDTPSLGRVVSGACALSSRFLFVPTDRCVYRLDLARQGFFDVAIPPPLEIGVPYPAFGTFGDLAVTDRALVSTSDLFTIVFRAEEE